MANKKTKKEFFKELLEVAEIANNEELTEFINHEITLLENKHKKSGLTANQKANEEIKKTILDILAQANKPLTISEIQAESEELAEFTNQKISALLTQLVKVNLIERIKEKKITTFKIVD